MPKSVFTTSAVPLGLVAAPEIGGAPAGKTLKFTIEPQRQNQWCWAAVTASIATFYRNRGWSQCRVVNDRLGETECCSDGSSSACNRPWYLDKALSRVGNLGGFTKGALTAQEVRTEIDNGRPIGVRIGRLNAAVISSPSAGIRPGRTRYSRSVVWPFDGVLSGIQFALPRNGRWTHAYRTIARGGRSASTTS